MSRASLPKRHRLGASPSILSRPVGSGGCRTLQRAVTLPAAHLSPPTAGHLEPAVVPERAEVVLPSPAEQRPLNEEQRPLKTRSSSLSRLGMAWPPTAGCGVPHYPSRTRGWSYDDFYQLEDKTRNVQFPALKALDFKDISNVCLSFK